MRNFNKIKRFFHPFVSGILVASFIFAPLVSRADEVTDLQQQIKDRQARIEALKRQAQQYEQSLNQKRKERVSLSNQISILSDRIEKTKVDIETTQTVIESTTLEIRELEDKIRTTEKQLDAHREELGSLVRWSAREQDQSAMRIFFTAQSFSEFADEIKAMKTVQLSMSDLIGKVEDAKASLEENKSSVENKRRDLVADVEELNDQRMSLQGQQETKEYLLEETKSSEDRYAALLDEAKREQQATSAEITNLERTVRERLKKQGVTLEETAPSAYIWPVANNRGITAQFHDPDYPFQRVFAHTGIDIRASHGTPVRAAASGYVARTVTGGAKGYGYVMIVHGGGIATVYGHVSKILVSQDAFVTQGQVIALSGGTPGTPGAGPFTTGAHLHFEVRKDGIPVNPLNYVSK